MEDFGFVLLLLLGLFFIGLTIFSIGGLIFHISKKADDDSTDHVKSCLTRVVVVVYAAIILYVAYSISGLSLWAGFMCNLGGPIWVYPCVLALFFGVLWLIHYLLVHRSKVAVFWCNCIWWPIVLGCLLHAYMSYKDFGNSKYGAQEFLVCKGALYDKYGNRVFYADRSEYIFKDNAILVKTPSGYGLLDKNGQQILECTYDFIPCKMRNGYTIIFNGVGCGLLSPKMEIIYHPKNYKSILCVDKNRVELISNDPRKKDYGDYEGNLK